MTLLISALMERKAMNMTSHLFEGQIAIVNDGSYHQLALIGVSLHSPTLLQ